MQNCPEEFLEIATSRSKLLDLDTLLSFLKNGTSRSRYLNLMCTITNIPFSPIFSLFSYINVSYIRQSFPRLFIFFSTSSFPSPPLQPNQRNRRRVLHVHRHLPLLFPVSPTISTISGFVGALIPNPIFIPKSQTPKSRNPQIANPLNCKPKSRT